MLFGSAFWVVATVTAIVAAPKIDPAPLDPRYPDMIERANAGVTDGLPSDFPVVARAKPGDDLQALIDATAASTSPAVPARIIQLTPGKYPLTATLNLRSGVVLRGASDGTSKLHLKLRGTFAAGRERGPDGFSTWTTGIIGRDVHHAGLEDLTVSYDESLPPSPTILNAPAAFINDPRGTTDLWVVAVRFTLARDCWLLRCRILNSGTHPVMIEASTHVSVVASEIGDAHNKGSDAGYFNITRSAYTLVDGVNVHAIRHLVIQDRDEKFPCRYNVIIRATLAVNINFRNGDSATTSSKAATSQSPPGTGGQPSALAPTRSNSPPAPAISFTAAPPPAPTPPPSGTSRWPTTPWWFTPCRITFRPKLPRSTPSAKLPVPARSTPSADPRPFRSSLSFSRTDYAPTFARPAPCLTIPPTHRANSTA